MHAAVRTLLSARRCAVMQPLARRWLATSPQFEAAVAALKKLPEEPPSEVKLRLYALYKQATVGSNATPKPGMFDVVGKYKWQAWADLGSMSKQDAEGAYIAICTSLGAAAAPSSSSDTAADSASPTPKQAGDYSTLEISQEGRVRTITLCRPEKRNAINITMYKEIMRAMKESAADPGTSVTVLTGKGPFYCAGNDLSNFTSIGSTSIADFAEASRVMMEEFVTTFISFPKLLIVAANGPAVGIPVTTLPLADYVLCAHTATFSAPLVGLGQTPEGCSSVTFPRLMGHARAMDVLVFGKKLTAAEAAACGLVNEVVEASLFRERVSAVAQAAAALPPLAAARAKALVRGTVAKDLEAANRAEGAVIKECWIGPEVQAAVITFLTKGAAAATPSARL